MINLGHIFSKLQAREHAGLFFAGLALVLAVGALGTAQFLARPEPVVVETPAPAPNPYGKVVLTAKAAIVYDLITGEVLYEKNAEAQLPLASLTKLLTLYAAADALAGGAPVPMTAASLAQEGDNGFSEGERFTFTELAKLALVASSNDAADAIAVAAERSRGMDKEQLLAAAGSAVGLSQTYTLNGTGLDESSIISGGYGSARDMALLAGAFLERVPGIARATLNATVSATSLDGRSYTLENTNPEVSTIPGLRLSKTGYTDLAGGNLAIVFDAGMNHPIAVVVLGSTREERFSDVDKLVRATASSFAGLLP